MSTATGIRSRPTSLVNGRFRWKRSRLNRGTTALNRSASGADCRALSRSGGVAPERLRTGPRQFLVGSSAALPATRKTRERAQRHRSANPTLTTKAPLVSRIRTLVSGRKGARGPAARSQAGRMHFDCARRRLRAGLAGALEQPGQLKGRAALSTCGDAGARYALAVGRIRLAGSE